MRVSAILALAISSALIAGCASTTTSNTARTSTEQLLVANAVDQALNKVDFSTLSGQHVFLQEKYVDCVDKNYLIASMRHRLFMAGAEIVDAADQADVVLELRTGAIGTASSASFIGVPEITLPGMLTLPEVRFIERKRQEGVAKLGIVAYDPDTHQALGVGGQSVAMSDDSNWFVVGMGPYRDGAVRRELQYSTQGSAAITRNRVPPTVTFAVPVEESPAMYAEAPQKADSASGGLLPPEPSQPVWAPAKNH